LEYDVPKQDLAPLPPVDAGQRYTITEAIRYLKTSRFTIYGDIAEGRLVTIKEGKRRFVPGSEIIRRCSVPKKPIVTGPLLRAAQAAAYGPDFKS
jgi:hypothetical protein